MHFLDEKMSRVVIGLGETVNGVPKDELGDLYLKEADEFIMNLEEFLRKDLKTLFGMFNSSLMAFFFTGRVTRFTNMDQDRKERYFKKWSGSRIPLFRTAAKTLGAIAGWSYYCNETAWEEMNYPGKTIGREHLTPTRLYGKEPWRSPDA